MAENCWEFMKCGREADGVNVEKQGVCPAAVETRADSIHGGKNGGRACWAIAGTFYNDETQGTFAQKFDTCMECDFYVKVSQEESGYLTAVEIQRIINRRK